MVKNDLEEQTKTTSKTENGGQLVLADAAAASANQTNNETDPFSGFSHTRFAGVPGAHPRPYVLHRGGNARHGRKGASATGASRTHRAGGFGAAAEKAPAPPSWGGEPTYKNNPDGLILSGGGQSADTCPDMFFHRVIQAN